jgi:hypothetical protein
MMAVVFATMFLALAFGWFGRRAIAGTFLIVCIVLFVGEFLWEVYSPEYGFSMPWIQTDARPDAPMGEG